MEIKPKYNLGDVVTHITYQKLRPKFPIQNVPTMLISEISVDISDKKELYDKVLGTQIAERIKYKCIWFNQNKCEFQEEWFYESFLDQKAISLDFISVLLYALRLFLIQEIIKIVPKDDKNREENIEKYRLEIISFITTLREECHLAIEKFSNNDQTKRKCIDKEFLLEQIEGLKPKIDEFLSKGEYSKLDKSNINISDEITAKKKIINDLFSCIKQEDLLSVHFNSNIFSIKNYILENWRDNKNRYSFLPPRMTIIKVEENKSQDMQIYASDKDGNRVQVRYVSKYKVKCKYFNPIANKFSEQWLIPEVLMIFKNETENFVDSDAITEED